MSIKHLLPVVSLWAILLVISCVDQPYQPANLRKLTPDEIYERMKAGEPPNPNAVLKSPNGEIIDQDSLQRIPDLQSWTTDVYVDADGSMVEYVMRKATPDDLELRARIQKMMQDGPEIQQIQVDCHQAPALLDTIMHRDQGMRTGELPYDPAVDQQNLVETVSIIEQCNTDSLHEDDIYAIWLVIQHAPSKFQKQYIPMFRELQQAGKLGATNVATMEDRILMSDGLPQRYGTQVTQNSETGAWELYTLEDPGTVNQRRAEIGFGPLGEYLSRWNIEFAVPQQSE